MDKDKKGLTKDRLVGMQVINSEGNTVGTVNDLAFTVGKLGMTLIVESKDGVSTEILWEEIQAAGDYIILKAKTGQAQVASTQQVTEQQTKQTQSQVCPTCGEPLTFIPQYNRWYCYKDKKYV
jgi:sporulation protein YlmC with PRC-barrel domain